MAVVQLGQPVVFRPGTAFEERWGPGQYLSGMVTSVVGNDASLIVWPAGEYPPYYELRVKRDDSLSSPRTWTPSISEDTEMPEAPSDGQIYGRRNQAWTPVSGAGGIGGGYIVVSDTQPPQPLLGMAWLDTTINNFFIFFQGRWVEPAHVNPTESMVVIETPFVSGTVAVDSTLVCTSGSWSGNPIGYTYQWFRDTTPIINAVQSLYTLTLTDVGHDIHCKVTARSVTELYVTAASNIISVRVPQNTVTPHLGGVVQMGAPLICSDGEWTGSGPIGFTYQWKRAGVIIAGETSNTHLIITEDVGMDMTCLVQALNLVGSASAVSNTVTVAVPRNLETPVVSGEASVGQVLNTTNGLWANIPTGYTYQWMRGATVIAGATAASYVLVTADGSNNLISCVVTASNPIGSSSATSNSILVSPPVNASIPHILPLDSALGDIGGTHICTQGTWNYSPTSFAYQWLRDGAGIAGATNNRYVLTGADIGKTLNCMVTAANANGSTVAFSDSLFVVAYAKFDPSTASNVALLASSSGIPDIRVQHTALVNGGAKTLTLKSTGKWFIKCAITSIWYADGGVGFLLSTGTLANMVSGLNCVKVRQQIGEIWANGVYTGKRIGGLAGNHSVSMAIDLDAKLAWFRFDNGNWNAPAGLPGETPGVNGGVSFPAGSYTPAVCYSVGNGSIQDITFNFGQTMADSEIPAGFQRGWPA